MTPRQVPLPFTRQDWVIVVLGVLLAAATVFVIVYEVRYDPTPECTAGEPTEACD